MRRGTLKVLWYALGGGRGHATRSRTLAGWLPPGSDAHFLLPERLRAWSQGLQAHFLGPDSLAEQVAERLDSLRPDLFLVDTFPRGVLGELAEVEFPCPAWLVARWLKPAYGAHPEVLRALDRYELVLGAELTVWEKSYDIGPVVAPPAPIRAPGEILWLGSGPEKAQHELRQLLSQAVVAAPDLGQERHDVAELLAGASLVISAGGYNAYHEIVQAGTPTIFWPQERRYDQQSLRVTGKLGPRPRAWHRCVQDLAGFQLALREWREIRPTPAGPQALARPEIFQGLFLGGDFKGRISLASNRPQI